MIGECCWIKGLGDEGLNFMLSVLGAEDEDLIVKAEGLSGLDSFLLLVESELWLLVVLWGKGTLILMFSFPFLFALFKLLLPLLLLWGLGSELYNKQNKENIMILVSKFTRTIFCHICTI